jgi:CheY-like chemotaxis protein
VDILFAEDHPANVQVLRQCIQALEIDERAQIAFNGEEFADLFAKCISKALERDLCPQADIQPVKIVFLDQQMPKLTGTQTLEKITECLH